MDIVIDLTPVINFLNLPPEAMAWRLLVLLGWIPILIAILWGIKEIWLYYIQTNYSRTLKNILLAIDIPKGNEQSPKAVENIFSQLWGSYADPNLIEKYIEGATQESFSFEIASTDGYIQYYVRTNVVFRDFIESIFYAQYPDAEIVEVPDYTQGFPEKFPNDEYKIEFKTKKKVWSYDIESSDYFVSKIIRF